MKSRIKISKPRDFEGFWERIMDELSRIDIAPEVTHIPLGTTDFATLYGVRFTSIGPYRIFAYLSIPNGKGSFPTIFHLPSHGSTVEPIPQGTANQKRKRFVIFSLAARGQRNADQPFAASYPGLLTEGIDYPKTYIFRGIVADCCRAIDYLFTRAEVDKERIAAIGNDLAIFTAALRPQIKYLVATPGPIYSASTLASQSLEYPLEEFNDYLRMYPGKKERVWRTLAYFEPLFFAPKVRATTLLQCGVQGEIYNPSNVKPLARAMGGETTIREILHSSYKDGMFLEKWVSSKLGFSDAILPEHWQ